MKNKERNILAGRRALWEALARPRASRPLKDEGQGVDGGREGEYAVLAYGIDASAGNTEILAGSSALCISCSNTA